MTAATLPTVQVLLDDGTGTFPYDITAYALDHSIRRGRQNEAGSIEASQLRLRLDNTDGRFTLGSATYNCDVDQGIRLIETVGATTATQFTGYVDEWPVAWPDSTDRYAEASITARDLMARLDRHELRSMLEEEIMLDDPAAYYTLGESSGSASGGDTSGKGEGPLVIIGSAPEVTFGNGTGPTDGLTAAEFAGGEYLSADVGSVTAHVPITLECCVLRAGIPAAREAAVSIVLPQLQFGRLILAIDAVTGYAQVLDIGISAPGLTTVLSSGVNVADGATHHLALTLDAVSTSTIRLYVDGTLRASAAYMP